jgi:hypothetical protein
LFHKNSHNLAFSGASARWLLMLKTVCNFAISRKTNDETRASQEKRNTTIHFLMLHSEINALFLLDHGPQPTAVAIENGVAALRSQSPTA